MNPGRELDALQSDRWAFVECNNCGITFQSRKVYISRRKRNFCTPKCSQLASRKNITQEFEGVTYYLSVNGYMENPTKKTKMHRVVWEHFNGQIPRSMLVHHKNGVKTDNRIENLCLESRGEHTSEHNRERWRSGLRIGKIRRQIKCIHEGCDRIPKAKNLCTQHYQQMKAKERGKWL